MMKRRMRCVRDGDLGQVVLVADDSSGDQPVDLDIWGLPSVIHLDRGQGFRLGCIYEVSIELRALTPDGVMSTDGDAPTWLDAKTPDPSWIRVGEMSTLVPVGTTIDVVTTVQKATRIQGIWIPHELRGPLSLVGLRIGCREQLTSKEVPCVALPGRMKLDIARSKERITIIVRNDGPVAARFAVWIVPE